MSYSLLSFSPNEILTSAKMNQVSDNFEAIRDGTAIPDGVLDAAMLGGTAGLLGNVLRYTAGATWTKPAGLRFVIVEVQAGGGGGGGCGSGSGNGNAGGGGGGGYSRKKILAANLSATEAVTVGAAGSGASAGANNGGTGGNSSFGAHATTTGGGGGTGAASTTGGLTVAGGSGGTGSSGDMNQRGQDGVAGSVLAGIRANWGQGGSSFFGHGGRAGGNYSGSAASGYGAGGGGGASSGSAASGGAGTAGYVVVYEYF